MAIVVEVVRTAEGPINTARGTAVVSVVGPPVVQNATVSPTAPANPYEGMVWIEVQ